MPISLPSEWADAKLAAKAASDHYYETLRGRDQEVTHKARAEWFEATERLRLQADRQPAS